MHRALSLPHPQRHRKIDAGKKLSHRTGRGGNKRDRVEGERIGRENWDKAHLWNDLGQEKPRSRENPRNP